MPSDSEVEKLLDNEKEWRRIIWKRLGSIDDKLGAKFDDYDKRIQKVEKKNFKLTVVGIVILSALAGNAGPLLSFLHKLI